MTVQTRQLLAILLRKIGAGDGGSNPPLNLCASYGLCTNINICCELQPSRNALVYARLAGFL